MPDRTITGLRLARKGLRAPFPKNLERNIKNARVLSVTRRAKYILVHLSNKGVLAIHLGMSGRIRTETTKTYQSQKHDHVVLNLSGGIRVILNDARRFGTLLYMTESELKMHSSFRNLGPEPLSRHVTSAVLNTRLKDRKTSIKQALLDQRVLAGIGNIYACEALFDARIHPFRMASSLSAREGGMLMQAIRDVLRRAIKAGGSTLRDYRQVGGEKGYFQHDFHVYDRAGEVCRICSGQIVRKVQGGRSTFFCPAHQK